MHLHDITADSLGKLLDSEVPEIYVVIAKHSVMGMDTDGVKDILGCTSEEILEVEADELYKTVRQRIAMAYAEMSAGQSTGWDAIESMAINALAKRLPYEKDGEFLLKAAAVANRATRRHKEDSNVLDPAAKQGRTAITLTQRIVQRLNRSGAQETVAERTLSIRDGSMSNPSFPEVDSLLSVRNVPALPKGLEIQTRNADPSMDELMEAMNEQMNQKE